MADPQSFLRTGAVLKEKPLPQRAFQRNRAGHRDRASTRTPEIRTRWPARSRQRHVHPSTSARASRRPAFFVRHMMGLVGRASNVTLLDSGITPADDCISGADLGECRGEAVSRSGPNPTLGVTGRSPPPLSWASQKLILWNVHVTTLNVINMTTMILLWNFKRQ